MSDRAYAVVGEYNGGFLAIGPFESEEAAQAYLTRAPAEEDEHLEIVEMISSEKAYAWWENAKG